MSSSIKVDGRRVEVLGLDEVAKEITGSWDSPGYVKRWQHLCEFYAEHPERTATRAATGPNPITIGEAQVYCLGEGLNIPDRLSTGRTQPEVGEYLERIEKERQSEKFRQLEARVERQAQALMSSQQISTENVIEAVLEERSAGGERATTTLIQRLVVEGQYISARAAADGVLNKIIGGLKDTDSKVNVYPFVDEKEDGLLWSTDGGSNCRRMSHTHVKRGAREAWKRLQAG